MKGHFWSVVCLGMGAGLVLLGIFAIVVGIIGLITEIEGAIECISSYCVTLALGLLICLISKECYNMENRL